MTSVLTPTPSAVLQPSDDVVTARLEQVFDPFFRSANASGQGAAGNGLGLYIARDLMQRQNGTIRLSNRVQGGLRAQIWLARAG